MDRPAAVSPEVGETANSALETLVSLHRHKRGCRQCRLDPSYCEPARIYERQWLKDFEVWEKLHERR